jgi:hypothetical protein
VDESGGTGGTGEKADDEADNGSEVGDLNWVSEE